MLDLTVLRENNPAVAASLELWISKYQRMYNFSRPEDQADFYEGMLEFGRHVATNSCNANLRLDVGSQGVTALSVGVTPKPSSPC